MTEPRDPTALCAHVMEQLAAGSRGEPTFDAAVLDDLADRLEDELDAGDLVGALAELSTLAAHLRERGLHRAAGLLARVVASFEGAVTELLEE